MKPFILVVGPSGAGKSMSFRNLDWKITKFADLERKGPPFKIPAESYFVPTSIEPKTFIEETLAFVKKCQADGTKILIIDSLSKLFEFCEWRSTIEGLAADGKQDTYKAWRLFAQYTLQFIELFKSKTVLTITTGHDETISAQGIDGKTTLQRRCKVNGKVWEGKIEKEFLIVMFAQAVKSDKGMTYQLTTMTDGITSAKCPPYFNIPAVVENDFNKLMPALLA